MDEIKIRSDETTFLPSKVESHGFVYQDDYKKIEKFTALFKNFKKEYFVSDYGIKSSVVVVREEKVLLVRQYRLLINALSYEIPGGRVDEKESPEDAGARECFEETGVKCLNLKPLINFNPDLEYTRNYTHVFLSNDAVDQKISNSKKSVWIPVDECIEMVFDERISDSLSVIALLALQKVMNRK